MMGRGSPSQSSCASQQERLSRQDNARIGVGAGGTGGPQKAQHHVQSFFRNLLTERHSRRAPRPPAHLADVEAEAQRGEELCSGILSRSRALRAENASRPSPSCRGTREQHWAGQDPRLPWWPSASPRDLSGDGGAPWGGGFYGGRRSQGAAVWKGGHREGDAEAAAAPGAQPL